MTDTAADGVPHDEATPEGDAPEQFQVPAEAIARWAAIEPGTPVKVSMTRQDVDHLLLGLRSLAIGQSQLVTALTGHINQDAQGSAEALLAADQLCVAAYSRINAFITVLMMAATPDGVADSAEPAAQ